MGFFGGGSSVDLASPSAIGSTTPNTGTFTTLVANTSLNASNIFGTGSTNGGVAIRATSTNTSFIECIGSAVLCVNGGNFTAAINRSATKSFTTTSDGYFAWGNTTINANAISPNATLYSDAADILAQRRTTNAQTFRLYNTFTDASNYERGFFRWNTNVLEIGAEAAGTGTQRTISFLGGSNNSAISFTSNSINAIFGNNANIFYKNIQSEASIRFSGLDLGISRNAAGVMELNNGTAGTFRDLIVRNLRMSAPTLVPASASATGSEGQISWDASYIYVCTAANTWKRVAIATW